MTSYKKWWWLLVIVSLGVTIPFAAPYFTLNPALSRVPVALTAIHFPLLIAHIMFACLALVSGFFQFIDRIRTKSPNVHRYLGRVYVGSVFLSGLCALAIVVYIENFTKAISFLALSLVWLFTCWKGYRAAVRKSFDEHRKWMIRSFGVTLAAVSGRVAVPVLLLIYFALHGLTLPEGREKMIEEALNVNIWAALLLNFMIVEWKLLASKRK